VRSKSQVTTDLTILARRLRMTSWFWRGFHHVSFRKKTLKKGEPSLGRRKTWGPALVETLRPIAIKRWQETKFHENQWIR
jgi:hypothetical protein